jgi:hypothetical protein
VNEFRQAGGDLVVIGNGAPFFARAFAEDMGLVEMRVAVLTDEPRASYELLGFRRGIGGFFSSRFLTHARRAAGKGFQRGKLQGDALQLGGVVVVRPGGQVVYAYASLEAGDHPPPQDIVAALRATAAQDA